MTTWNGAASIGASIASILGQSFTDFELVVVDDGSTDGTATILAGITDPRLRVLRPPRNLGIVGARNLGFAACQGEYLAALDHDDLSHPDRLARQVAHLDQHAGVVLLGTGVEIESAGRRHAVDHPPRPTPLLLRWMLLVGNPFAWSSVMIRTAALHRLGGFLRPEAEYADDFDLYHRLLTVGEADRLEAVLTTYRWHASNTTHTQGGPLNARAATVLAEAYRPLLGKEAPAAAALVVRHLSDRQPVPDAATLARLRDMLARLLAGFCAGLPLASRAEVEAATAWLWWRVVRAAVRSGNPALIRLRARQPGLRRGFRPGMMDLAASLGIGLLRSQPGIRRLLMR
jgi:glycosyltransferase involved in cell wall biosynthesis